METTVKKNECTKQSESSKLVDKDTPIKQPERFHKSLNDVALYSFGGLCAISLLQLFEDDCHRDFKKKALDKILKDLGQPKKTHDSMFAILEGEIMTSGNAFVDALLDHVCLRESRLPLVEDMINMAICDGCYDARMRVLIKHIAWQLRVTWDQMEDIESDLAEKLEYSTYVMSEEEAKEKKKKTRNRKVKRFALIGLATVGGGALIGLTGGLAAPLVAAGAGAIIGGGGAAILGSTAGIAIIGSLFGVAGAGLTGFKMKRRVGAVEEFSFEPLTSVSSRLQPTDNVKQLHITIAITGWLNEDMHDFCSPWRCLAESREQYSLCWESKYLYQLGQAFDYIVQTGITIATTEALKYTVLAGIITAIAWPAGLLAAAGAIDNPWHVCTQRATEAGKLLAEVLLSRQQGNRPVTLIGFSMGARVVFSCLQELSRRRGSEGLVEDVILLGAPVSGDPKHWKPLVRVVAGKIVNGYSRTDWMLKFLFRTVSVTLRVAGLGPIKWDNRRMHNIDLSDVIDGHMDYSKNLDIIMKAVGVRTKDELKPVIPKSHSEPITSDSRRKKTDQSEKTLHTSQSSPCLYEDKSSESNVLLNIPLQSSFSQSSPSLQILPVKSEDSSKNSVSQSGSSLRSNINQSEESSQKSAITDTVLTENVPLVKFPTDKTPYHSDSVSGSKRLARTLTGRGKDKNTVVPSEGVGVRKSKTVKTSQPTNTKHAPSVPVEDFYEPCYFTDSDPDLSESDEN